MTVSSAGSTSSSPAPVQSTAQSFSQIKTQNDSQLVTLLPSPSFGGLGANVNLYDAISKQSQGLLQAGGRAAMEIANISLGIDQSQVFSFPSDSSTTATPATSPATAADQASADASTAATAAPATSSGSQSLNILDQILKQDGYVAPPADPYVYQKDFFQSQDPIIPVASSPAQYYQNIVNQSLGGTVNSVG